MDEDKFFLEGSLFFSSFYSSTLDRSQLTRNSSKQNQSHEISIALTNY